MLKAELISQIVKVKPHLREEFFLSHPDLRPAESTAPTGRRPSAPSLDKGVSAFLKPAVDGLGQASQGKGFCQHFERVVGAIIAFYFGSEAMRR